MNSEQSANVNKEKEELTQKILKALLVFGKKSQAGLSAVDHARYVFDILHRISAACIAESAASYDNLEQISEEMAKATKQLALLMYSEKDKNQ